MPSNVGVVFISTGGHKMARTLRSFRRTEPDLTAHIIFDTSSRPWRERYGVEVPLDWFRSEPNVQVREVSNTGYVNGGLNKGMLWMRELGKTHGCLFHDDIIFSPLAVHHKDLSKWFARLDTEEDFKNASGISLNFMPAFIPAEWYRTSEEWDKVDLESETFWNAIFTEDYPKNFLPEDGAYRIHFGSFFLQLGVPTITIDSSLGPTGAIVPVETWSKIGGFDETRGIFYDAYYPAECSALGLPPVYRVPSIPHIHLHNQSVRLDPAGGLWANHAEAFERHFKIKPIEFWAGKTPPCYLL